MRETRRGGYQSGGGSGYQNVDQFRSDKDAFFARRQVENAGRPDNLPPNQGGKYSGFGYTMDAPPRSTSQEFFDTAVSSFASGWSLFSSGATKIASKATEGAFKIGTIATQKVSEISTTVGDKVKDGSVLDNVSTQVMSLASKMGDLGRKGWQDIGGTNSELPPPNQLPDGTEKSSLLTEGNGMHRSLGQRDSSTPLMNEGGRRKSATSTRDQRDEWGWGDSSRSSNNSSSNTKEWDNWSSTSPDGDREQEGGSRHKKHGTKKKSSSSGNISSSTQQGAREGLLIDFAEERSNASDWNEKWGKDEDPWDMLNKKD